MEYSIGEFAILMNVTVKTLHHYDKQGILPPQNVDQLTGYRKYGSSQFETMNQIRFYRNLGISLANIKRIIADEATDAMVHQVLSSKKRSLLSQVSKDLQTISSISTLLDEPLEHDIMYPPYVDLRACSPRLAPPLVSQHDGLQEPLNHLLALSVRMKSTSAGALKKAVEALILQFSQSLSPVDIKELWYWIQVPDNEADGPYRLNAGMDVSRTDIHIPGAVPVEFPEPEKYFMGHCFNAFDTASWTATANHMHHEMFSSGHLPTGPFFVRLTDDPGDLYRNMFYQAGSFDGTIRKGFDEEEESQYMNPFMSWSTYITH